MSELYLPIIPPQHKTKRTPRPKINWTAEMLEKLRNEFPYRFNKELANELGIGWRTLVRKARQLGIEKETDFLNKNRETISQMAIEAHPPQPTKGKKGWCVPNSESHRFKPGQLSSMKKPEVAAKARSSRNETIRKERLRIKYGLKPKTKLNLKPIY